MGRYSSRYGGWRPYVPMHERRRLAQAKLAKMRKAGHEASPVVIEGRKIATTFWGQAWCENLEAYSDYANRMPRGRTYARNGSVIDLQIERGKIHALVCGSSLYTVDVVISPLPRERWAAIKAACGGQIGSLVELLQGRISGAVMQIVSRPGEGLFPSPKEIQLHCSCPDWATLCKHVAATLYGVGARLDHSPELLFTLRGVDPTEMVEAAVSRVPASGVSSAEHALATESLSDIFGVDIDLGEEPQAVAPGPESAARRSGRGRRAKGADGTASRERGLTKSARASAKAASSSPRSSRLRSQHRKTVSEPDARQPQLSREPPASKASGQTPSASKASRRKKPPLEAGGQAPSASKASRRKKPPLEASGQTPPASKASRRKKPPLEVGGQTPPASKASRRKKPPLEAGGQASSASKASRRKKPPLEAGGQTPSGSKNSRKQKPSGSKNSRKKEPPTKAGGQRPQASKAGQQTAAADGSGRTRKP